MRRILFSIFLVLGTVNLFSCTSGSEKEHEIYANPPKELIEHVEALLPAAELFIRENEARAQEKGIPLNSNQLIVATKVGLDSPNKVRVYYVDHLPFPKDPTLAKLAMKFGYGSPRMAAHTYGYGIWIKNTARGNRELMSHELIHVRQAEQKGVREQIKQYLMQLFIYGYDKAPMELEAYSEASKHI